MKMTFYGSFLIREVEKPVEEITFSIQEFLFSFLPHERKGVYDVENTKREFFAFFGTLKNRDVCSRSTC